MQSQLLLLKLEDCSLTEEEQKQIKALLANPAVQKYFKVLHVNAMMDVNSNPVETEEQKSAFLARYMRFQGVRQVCEFIESNYGKKG